MEAEKWYTEDGIQDDVVFASEIRIARNLRDYPFPQRLSTAGKSHITELICNAFCGIVKDKLYHCDLSVLSGNDIVALHERIALRPGFTSTGSGLSFLLSEKEDITVQLMQSDHLRLYKRRTGFALDEIFDFADNADNMLCEKLGFAFDKTLGYLTANPANLGTAMKPSCILHLPGYAHFSKIPELVSGLSKTGFEIHAVPGESAYSNNYLYRISNCVTLGISERNSIDNLAAMVLQIATRERAYREKIENLSYKAEEAYGLLSSSVTMTADDMNELLSIIRICRNDGEVKISNGDINAAMLTLGDANMLNRGIANADKITREFNRASILRGIFA